MNLAFLSLGIVLALVAIGLLAFAVRRWMRQGRRLPEWTVWQGLLGMVNAAVATVFLTLSIVRILGGSGADAEPVPADSTAQIIVVTPPGGSDGRQTTSPPQAVPTPPPPMSEENDRSPPEIIIVRPPPVIPTEQAPPSVTISVTITRPRDGDVVPLSVRVDGASRGVAPGQPPDSPPPWLYLLVRRFDAAAGETWWVQPYPVVRADGTWEAFLSEGLAGVTSTDSLDICAIVTRQFLPVGQFGAEPPAAISRHCILVTVA